MALRRAGVLGVCLALALLAFAPFDVQSAPSGQADGAGYVYVADTFNQRIQKLTPDGQPILIVGEAGSGAGQFRDPHAVAVDPEGALYVADTGNHRIQRLAPASR